MVEQQADVQHTLNLYEIDVQKRVEAEPLAVKKGDRVLIKLQENPTTGFIWQLNEPTQDILTVE